MDHQLWKEIPNDILQLILQFDGRIKKRNGAYMNQILKIDERYKLLRSIPRKEFFGTKLSLKRLFLNDNKIIIETFVYFRNKRDDKNNYCTIYFEEQLEPPHKITHHFGKSMITNIESFVLP